MVRAADRARSRKGPADAALTSAADERDALIAGIVDTWRRHSDILLYLLAKIPAKGLAALPSGSRGRDVALQFHHLDRVRRGWLHIHATGQRPELARADKGKPPTAAQLRSALTESGKEVAAFLSRALRGEARTRMFGGQPLRYLGYLIAHESHHRGQIMLALKQSGIRLGTEVSIEGIWGTWFMGK